MITNCPRQLDIWRFFTFHCFENKSYLQAQIGGTKMVLLDTTFFTTIQLPLAGV